jgi:large repetitive protein
LVSGSGTTRTVTITNTTGDGTIGISIAAGTASDMAGNTAGAAGPSATFIVDNTPPSIACPTNVIVSADAGCSATNVALGSPVTSDANGIASVTNNGLASYAVGTNTVTWTVRDNVGLTNTCNQLVIVRDTQAPSITCSSNVIVNATNNCPVVVNFIVGATDNCGLTNLVVTPGTGSAFPVGTNVVIALAQDAAGNSNTCSFTVTVLAGAPPRLAVARAGTNAVVSWPATFPCYVLQQASALVAPPATGWTPHSGPFKTNGGNIYITNSLAISNRFFRLTY